MGLLNRFAQYIIGKAGEFGGVHVAPWMQGRPYNPDVSYIALIKRYRSYVYACATKNAVSCAQIPLRLYAVKPTRKSKSLFKTKSVSAKRMDYMSGIPQICQKIASGDVEEVIDHPFLDIMRNVNGFMNQFDLLESVFLHQDLVGNAYWYIERGNSMGVPTEIWPLLPQYVKIIPDKEKFIAGYEYKPNPLEKVMLDVDSVVQYKYISPTNAFYGLGPLQACVVAADLGTSMNEYETAMIQNGAHIDMALVMPADAGKPNEAAQKLMQADWKKKQRGIKNIGKLPILSGGASLTPVSYAPKEMAFLQGRKASLQEVAAVFGVPMSKLTVENVNRANAEAGDYSYMKDTILPRLRRVEQKINEQLLPMFDERLFCTFDNPVPADKEFRLKETESHLKAGYSTINEERQHDGKEDVEWGNEPVNLNQPEPMDNQSGEVKSRKHLHKANKAPRRLPPLGMPTNFVSDAFLAEMKKYYSDVSKDILANFDKDSESLSSAQRRYSGGWTKDVADDYASAWFDKTKWDAELVKRQSAYVEFAMDSAGERAIKSVDSSVVYENTNPDVAKSLAKHREGTVRSANSTIVKGLRKQISLGMDDDISLTAMRNGISDYFGGLEKYAALRIARTEMIWAFNEGAMQGYKQSGVVEKKVWVSSGDDRTCDFCPQMDGKVVGIDATYFDKGDIFKVGDSELNFEYEEVGHPPIHPNCRCAIAPVVEAF